MTNALYILGLIVGALLIGIGVKVTSYFIAVVGAIILFGIGTWNGRLWERGQ